MTLDQVGKRLGLPLVASIAVAVPQPHVSAQLSPDLVVSHSTFIGTHSGDDEVSAIATDLAGNVYVAGYTTYDLTHPGEPGIPRRQGNLLIPHPTAGNECYFGCGYVLKLDAQRQLVYGAVMYGMRITAIAVDVQQNVYITGRTDVGSQFPWTPSSFDTAASPPPAGAMTPTAFVAKLDASGNTLDYASLFVAVEGKGIAVDSTGSAFVVGLAQGPGLPATPGSLRPAYQPTSAVFHSEGFLLKVSPSGATLDYATYLGGSGADEARAVAVGATGGAIVVGLSESLDFLPTVPAGAKDGFAIEVAANGASIARSRFLGGAADDSAVAVAHDGAGGYLLAGATISADFPVTPGVLQNRLMGQQDGWIARLDENFTPRYATLLGGSDVDGVHAIVGDGSGNTYFAGGSLSADLLTTSRAFQDSTAQVTEDQLAAASRDYYPVYPPSTLGVVEAHFGVLSADGTTLHHATYLSGYYTVSRGFDPGAAANTVARTPAGAVYVGGSTNAASFPVTDGGFRPGMSGVADGFITELKPQSFRISTESVLPVAEMDGAPYSARLESSGGIAPVAWRVVGFRLVEGLSLSADGLISGSAVQAVDATGASLTESGAYQFTAKATDASGAVTYKSFFLPTRFAGQPVCANGRCSHEGHLGNELPLYPAPIPRRAQLPLTLSLTGTLPPGITLDAGGRFRGRTTTAGRYLPTLEVGDATGRSVALTWDLNIVDPNPPPVPAPPPAPIPPGGGSQGSGGGGFVDILSLATLLALLCLAKPSLRFRSALRSRAAI